MELNREICGRARRARDPRYDGSFFVGVKTTGIFCRPICPAPLAKEENVLYYPSASAASSAGLRPCLRCKPEAAPGTPEWDSGADVVRRGLLLIKEGFLNEAGVAELGRRVGVGERHLRRLFKKYLGAPPVEVANMHRVFFAKNLLENRDLSITNIALASGFGTIRQFNGMFQKIYGVSPGGIRKNCEGKVTKGRGFQGTLKLSYRPPYDWDGVLEFLKRRLVNGVERVDGGSYYRTFKIKDSEGWLKVENEHRRNRLSIDLTLSKVQYLMPVVSRVRRIFDLDFDPISIGKVFEKDDTLGPLIRKYPGLRIVGAWSPFEYCIRAVLGQQVSVAGATTMAGRVARKFGPVPKLKSPGGLENFFPDYLDLMGKDLSGLGLTNSRILTIKAIVEAVSNGELLLDWEQSLDELTSSMVAIKGVGPWTAHYTAMRGFSHPDAFPSSDLGILKALGQNRVPVKPDEAERVAEGWRPWRAYGAFLLWKKLEDSNEC